MRVWVQATAGPWRVDCVVGGWVAIPAMASTVYTFSVTEAGCVEGGGGWSGVWRMRGVGVRAGEGVRAQKEAVC